MVPPAASLKIICNAKTTARIDTPAPFLYTFPYEERPRD